MMKSGWGAGQRNPKHYPNALRLLLAEQGAEGGRVALLATDVDDMSPEYVEPLRQALVAAGALDVQTWPVQMKKGRSGFRVEVVAPEECAEAVTAALFRHSTTAGIRRWVAERATLARRHVTVRLSPEVTVRGKVLEQPDAEGVRVEPGDEHEVRGPTHQGVQGSGARPDAGRRGRRPWKKLGRLVLPGAVLPGGQRSRGRGLRLHEGSGACAGLQRRHRLPPARGVGAGLQRRHGGVAGGEHRLRDRGVSTRQRDLPGRALGLHLPCQPVYRSR